MFGSSDMFTYNILIQQVVTKTIKPYFYSLLRIFLSKKEYTEDYTEEKKFTRDKYRKRKIYCNI